MAGCDRISINPQTMNDAVLQAIGRSHTTEQICTAYAQARAAGFHHINMDLIAGLPGDTVESFAASLEQAIALDPENITVHTLTLKRASNLVIENRDEAYADVAAMVELANQRLAAAGYRPYYLYRQKNTLKNLENTGWCKPVMKGTIISISWRRSIPSCLPEQAAAPSCASRAAAASNGSSTTNIRRNTSMVSMKFSAAKKE